MHLLELLMLITHTYSTLYRLVQKTVSFTDTTSQGTSPFLYNLKAFLSPHTCSLDCCAGLLKTDSMGCHLVFSSDFFFKIQIAMQLLILGVTGSRALGTHVVKQVPEWGWWASFVARVNLDVDSPPSNRAGPIYKSNLLFFLGQWFISLLNWLDQLVFYFY